MTNEPEDELDELAQDDELDLDELASDDALEQDEPELPEASERTLVLDAVDIPPPGEEPSDGPAEWEQGPEDVLDDSELPPAAADEDYADPDAGPAEEPQPEEFGGPEDGSEEQPLLVVGGSDEAPALDEPLERDELELPVHRSAGRRRDSTLRGAYEYLTIRTPIAEFESYARARTEALARLGETEEAEISALAMRLGADALRRVMGAIPKEAQ